MIIERNNNKKKDVKCRSLLHPNGKQKRTQGLLFPFAFLFYKWTKLNASFAIDSILSTMIAKYCKYGRKHVIRFTQLELSGLFSPKNGLLATAKTYLFIE